MVNAGNLVGAQQRHIGSNGELRIASFLSLARVDPEREVPVEAVLALFHAKLFNFPCGQSYLNHPIRSNPEKLRHNPREPSVGKSFPTCAQLLLLHWT